MAALFIILLVVLLFRNKGAIIQRYYEKKLERAGVTYFDQAFLNTVSTISEETVNVFIRAGMKLAVKTHKDRRLLSLLPKKEMCKSSPGFYNRMPDCCVRRM